MKKIFPGILLSLLVAIIGKILSIYIKGPGAICLAIISGILIGNLLKENLRKKTIPGISKIEKILLPIAIALMGIELRINTLSSIGNKAFYIIIPSMIAGILFAFFIGKILRLPSKFAILLGIGNSVCGSSAIIASAPTLKNDESQIGVSISAVNLAGTIGIFLIPILSILLKLTPENSSFLIGGSLQAIGQVVAAGFSLSDEIGDYATIIKMLRVLMIGPIVIILSILFKNKDEKKKIYEYIPLYIIGFIFFAITGSFFQKKNFLVITTGYISKTLLLIAMAAVGLKIHLKPLLKQGPKALIIVILSTLVQIITILMLINIFK